jgi:transposase, IS6 family
LKREGKLEEDVEHRQVKYLNNVIEADHGKLKACPREGGDADQAG